MARYTGPRVRIARRIGFNVFENKKGDKALQDRPYPPGENGRKRTRELVNIERLRFADLNLATDMNGTAGHIVKLLGALFGPSAVDDPHLAGYGVRLFDAGLAADQVAEIGAHALGLGDHQSLCEMLWANIVGTPPQDISLISAFIDRLSTFEITEGDLILEAANHPLNLANIDFVGLSETGLLYL